MLEREQQAFVLYFLLLLIQSADVGRGLWVQQLTQEVEQQASDRAQAEQQVGDLKAVEGQLELEVARLQHQLQAVEGLWDVGQLQGQLQSEVKMRQAQLQPARPKKKRLRSSGTASNFRFPKSVLPVCTLLLFTLSCIICFVLLGCCGAKLLLHSSWCLGRICCASEC